MPSPSADIVQETFDVCVKELGQRTTDVLVEEAHQRFVLSSRRYRVPQWDPERGWRSRWSAESETRQRERHIVRWLWQGLAVRRPSLFGERSLVAEGSAGTVELALLHALHREPEQLLLYEPTPEEQDLQSAGLRWLSELTDLPCPARSIRVVGPQGSWWRAAIEWGGFAGLSFYDNPALRDEVLICGDWLEDRRREQQPQEVARLIVHESIHAAVAARASGGCDGIAHPLTLALDEASVSLLEAAASAHWQGLLLSHDSLACQPTAYPHQLTALLGLLDDELGPAGLLQVADIASRNLEGRSVRTSVALLNEMWSAGSDARGWRTYLGDVLPVL